MKKELKLPIVGTKVNIIDTSDIYNADNLKNVQGFYYISGYATKRGMQYYMLSPEVKAINYAYLTIASNNIKFIDEDKVEYEKFFDKDNNPLFLDTFYETSRGQSVKVYGISSDLMGYDGSIVHRIYVLPKGNRSFLNSYKVELNSLVKITPKPKLNNEQKNALLIRTSALEYIFKICSSLGFDSNSLTEADINNYINIYNTKTKSELNKEIINKFENKSDGLKDINFIETIKKSLNFGNDFDIIDYKLNELEQKILNMNDTISYYNNEIHYYNSKLNQLSEKIIECNNVKTTYSNKINNINKEILSVESEIKSHKENLNNNSLGKENFISNIINNLNLTIKSIIENSNNFYSLKEIKYIDSGTIDSIEDLCNIEVNFITNRIFVKDASSPRISFDAGQFIVNWFPFFKSNKYPNPDLKFNPFFKVQNFNTIKVYQYKDNTIINSIMHPHVRDSLVCWGEVDQTTFTNLQFNLNYEFTGNPSLVFNKLKGILCTYNSASPYIKLTELLLKKDPTYKDRLDTEFRSQGNATLINLDLIDSNGDIESSNMFKTMSNKYYKLIHPISVNKIRDIDGRLISIDDIDKSSCLTCKLYIKRFVGIDKIIPRGELRKKYLKLKNNEFVEFLSDDKIKETNLTSNNNNNNTIQQLTEIPF